MDDGTKYDDMINNLSHDQLEKVAYKMLTLDRGLPIQKDKYADVALMMPHHKIHKILHKLPRERILHIRNRHNYSDDPRLDYYVNNGLYSEYDNHIYSGRRQTGKGLHLAGSGYMMGGSGLHLAGKAIPNYIKSFARKHPHVMRTAIRQMPKIETHYRNFRHKASSDVDAMNYALKQSGTGIKSGFSRAITWIKKNPGKAAAYLASAAGATALALNSSRRTQTPLDNGELYPGDPAEIPALYPGDPASNDMIWRTVELNQDEQGY